jgi:hypothetical protein
MYRILEAMCSVPALLISVAACDLDARLAIPVKSADR